MTYRVPYAAAEYGADEIAAVVRALQDPAHLVAGPKIEQFEDRIADLLGMNAGVMVNSGSSANLLALLALKERFRIPDGAPVLTPVLTGGWVVGPILQAGLKPVFCDVEAGTYVASVAEIRLRLAETNARAVLYPMLLGNSADVVQLRPELVNRGVPLLVDSCDTLNPDLRANLQKTADAVTTSFYASHIITAAGTGGMACFRSIEAAKYARLLAYWGRQSIAFGDADDLDRRFSYKLDGAPYDAKFLFAEEGYNLQPLELQAAFGIEQLRSLGDRIRERRTRFMELTAFFRRYEGYFILPVRPNPTAMVWLAYPLTVSPTAPFSRMDFARHLETAGIQTRPIMGGNILRQPAFRHLRDGRIYPVADAIMRNGLMIGCHQSLDAGQMQHIRDTVTAFMESF